MVFPKKPAGDSAQNMTQVCTFRDGIIPEIADLASVPIRTGTIAPLEVSPLESKPVSANDLAGGPFTMRKYYRPLSPGSPKAADLYARIINIRASGDGIAQLRFNCRATEASRRPAECFNLIDRSR